MQEEISLKELWFVIQKRWKWILLCTVLGGLLFYLVTEFFIPKRYTSSLELYVNNSENASSSGNVDVNDITASQKLANTYIVVLKNPSVLKQVASKLGSLTADELSDVLSFNSVEETEVLRISAETKDPQLSADICNAVAEVAPSVLQRVVKAGSVDIIGAAEPSAEPSYPHVMRSTFIGALLFLILSNAAFFVIYFFDNTVKGEEDVRQRLGIPVIGEVPSMDVDKKGGFRYV